MAATPLSFTAAVNPSSSAASSDVLREEFDFRTGDINVGNEGADTTWVSSLVRDVTVGLIVAMAAKWAWSKIK